MKIQIFGVIKKAMPELEGKRGVFIKDNQTRILLGDTILKKCDEAISISDSILEEYPRVDFFQLVITFVKKIDGVWKVLDVNGKDRKPFYVNKESEKYKYSLGAGRILLKKGKRISEIEVALIVRDHKPFVVTKSVIDVEIPMGINEELIKTIVPEISKEALEFWQTPAQTQVPTNQFKKPTTPNLQPPQQAQQKTASDNANNSTPDTVMAEAFKKAGIKTSK